MDKIFDKIIGFGESKKCILDNIIDGSLWISFDSPVFFCVSYNVVNFFLAHRNAIDVALIIERLFLLCRTKAISMSAVSGDILNKVEP
jgi:hypothetical protein